jgi:carboxypeptidase C (cathepsin A)
MHILVVILAFVSVSFAVNPFQNVGYITVSESRGANMFYWFFEAMNGNASAPVILWLQGGPGCSAMMGLFNENGPYQVTESLELVPNNNTWNQYYHMLYIDNPVGTGFSYANSPSDYVTTEDEMGADLYTALVYFFGTLFSQYSKNDFYIFGESYAGKYIPTIANVIFQQNSNQPPLFLNLVGVGIGDGWVDPITQCVVYSDFCYQTGLIDYNQMKLVEQWQEETVTATQNEDWFAANNWWNNVTLQIMLWSGMVNPADIRLYGFESFAPFDVTTAYVTQSSIREQLGVGSVNFTMINGVVANYLVNDSMQSVKSIFPVLLDDAKIKVLLFNGNFDYTVPITGTEAWLATVPWSGQAGFNAAARTVWNVNNNTAGYAAVYENLSFITVVQAGHMAAMDQPANVLDMVVRFVENKPFDY